MVIPFVGRVKKPDSVCATCIGNAKYVAHLPFRGGVMPEAEEQERMSGRQRRLHLILKALGFSRDMSSFAERLKKQKLICLLQHAGIGLDYRFNWYVHGPYSPDLARDLYGLMEYDDETLDSIPPDELPSNLREHLNTLDQQLAERREDRRYLEMAGSAAYLLSRGHDAEEVLKRLPKLKPKFRGDEEALREIVDELT